MDQPPKILDQLLPEILKEPESPPAASMTPPPSSSDGRGSFSPPVNRRVVFLGFAMGGILLAVLASALLWGFFSRERSPGIAEPAEIARALATDPNPSRTAPRPRISIPVPIEPDYPFMAPESSRKELIEKMAQLLDEDIAKETQGLKPFIEKAGLGLYDPGSDFAADDLASLSAPERTLLLEYQSFFSSLGESLGTASNRESERLQLESQYDRIVESLSLRKKLEISKLVLCRKVNGFGVYEPFPKAEFTAESLPYILVYTELKYFKPFRQANGRHLMSLSGKLVLLADTPEKKEVWSEREVAISDECASRRLDYFMAQRLRLPEDFPPGNYLLQASVTEMASGESAKSSVPLVIAAP